MRIKEFYDCNFWYGFNYLNEELSVDMARVNQYVDYYAAKEISPKIFFSNFFSVLYDPEECDRDLSSILKKSPNFFGNFVFPASFLSMAGNFKKYVEKMFKDNFRIMRLYPKKHKYSIDIWAFRKIFEILNYYCFPVMVSLDELDITGNKSIDWSQIYGISKYFNKIPLIIDGNNSKELMFNGYFFQLLGSTENLYLETHNLLAFHQLEDLAEKFSSKRLLLGSFFPIYPHYLSYERILYAQIPENSKEDILYLNFNNILNSINI